MSERKSGAFRVPKAVRDDEATDFPRPDSEQAREGAPPHEHERGAEHKDADNQNDRAHGYSQDSGYQGAGGYVAPGEDEQKPAQTHTQRPGNGHTHTDQEISVQIQRRLSRERAPRAQKLMVSVGQGVVTLRGEVADETERKRLTDIVRSVGAVRELRDELSTHVAKEDIN